MSGPMVDYFGRKKATFLVNIPHVIAWILMYYAWNIPTLFVANALLGVGTGVMEAPITAYVSEIRSVIVTCNVTHGKRLPSSVDSSNFFIKFFLMRDYVQQKNNGCCLQSTAGRGTLPIFCDRQPACPPWRLGYYIPMANIPNYSFEDTKYLRFFFF